MKRTFFVQNIDWDCDGDKSLKKSLPKSMKVIVTADDVEDITDMQEIDDYISDYISDQTGFCHYGYNLKEVG